MTIILGNLINKLSTLFRKSQCYTAENQIFMAREKLSAGIDEVNGATSPGHIHRVKRFRDARGRIIGVGVQETYNVKHPRNWKKKPAEWYQEALHTFRCLCTYHDHAGTQSQSTKIAFFC